MKGVGPSATSVDAAYRVSERCSAEKVNGVLLDLTTEGGGYRLEAGPVRCACGEPLHYSNAETEAQIARLTAELGEYVTVALLDGRYRVQRHYIALHGVTGSQIPRLADEGVVERLAVPTTKEDS